MKGSSWVAGIAHVGINRTLVMAEVRKAVEAGLFVQWPMVPIIAGGGVVFYASSDYFAIGEPGNYVLVPLGGPTAQWVADYLGLALPTPKMVDLIWRQAAHKLAPLPMTPPHYPYDSSMMSVERFLRHNDLVAAQRKGLPPGQYLTAGHKKDVVVCNAYASNPKKLCLYGWHRKSGVPIQGPYHQTHHELSYYDYSHGVRFIGGYANVIGTKVPIVDALRDFGIAPYISGEGALRVVRVPGVPLPGEALPGERDVQLPELRLGSRGVLVERWQRIVRCAPDGVFGPITEGHTGMFQEAHSLPSTGVVDRATWLEGLKLEAERSSKFPSTPAIQMSDVKFVQARNYTRASRSKDDIKWIVIHSMEASEHPQTAENCAAWFAGPHAPKASAHFCVDSDSIVQCVYEADVAWHAKGGNRHGIGIEHAGYAKQTDPEWRDGYSMAMLRLSAALCADLCKRFDIPAKFVDEEGLRRHDRGITYHKTITEAFNVVGGHMDPGEHFPIDLYLSMVRESLSEEA